MDATTFITEFQKLYLSTPQISHWTRSSENCEYGDIIVVSKDSYLCFWSANLEKCYYAHESRKSTSCADMTFCDECELCYDCIDCAKCYNLDHAQDCKQCMDCSYCYGCIGCNDCFGCAGLIRKKFCIFNVQYSKEEYLSRLAAVKKQPVELIESNFEEVKCATPRIFTHEFKNENSFGDYLYENKNCYWCFDSVRCEDSAYIYNANLERGTKDSIDCGPVANTLEQCYDCAYCGYIFDSRHIYWCDWLSHCRWCINVWSSNHCFGCIYLQHKEYMFLNQPISKTEYEKVTEKLTKELYQLGCSDLYETLHPGPHLRERAQLL